MKDGTGRLRQLHRELGGVPRTAVRESRWTAIRVQERETKPSENSWRSSDSEVKDWFEDDGF